jgi:hypothetical protein
MVRCFADDETLQCYRNQLVISCVLQVLRTTFMSTVRLPRPGSKSLASFMAQHRLPDSGMVLLRRGASSLCIAVPAIAVSIMGSYEVLTA